MCQVQRAPDEDAETTAPVSARSRLGSFSQRLSSVDFIPDMAKSDHWSSSRWHSVSVIIAYKCTSVALIFGGWIYSWTCVCFTDFLLATMDHNSSLLSIFAAMNRPMFVLYEQNYDGCSRQREILPVIRVEMKDHVYIQVILNGWGVKASPGTPLHINKKLLWNGIIQPCVYWTMKVILM